MNYYFIIFMLWHIFVGIQNNKMQKLGNRMLKMLKTVLLVNS